MTEQEAGRPRNIIGEMGTTGNLIVGPGHEIAKLFGPPKKEQPMTEQETKQERCWHDDPLIGAIVADDEEMTADAACLNALEADVRRYRTALEAYGRHKNDCHRFELGLRFSTAGDCTCGLDSALSGEEK